MPLPAGGQLLLDWFWDLNPGRPASTAGYLGLPAAEIEAWQRLRGVRLRQWQLDALRQLDSKFLQVMSEQDGPG